ncbi:MAG: tetratricopeptide repeat protein, partial [Alphaproteobacteria bacterium]|nr:tetratricopeptide repeat protein [Alphaproteobacteria bacterium]
MTIVTYQRGLSAATIIMIGLVVTACQTSGPKSVSLDEAKKITAEFQGPSFTPPPRSTSDVIALLGQEFAEQEASGSIEREAARTLIANEPAPGLSDIETARFLWKRGMAARRIGDVRKYLDDLKEAARLSENADIRTRSDILWHLSFAESLAGNLAEALRYREESIALIPDNRRGVTIGRSGSLSVLYARGGDLAAAENHLTTAEDVFAEAESWPAWGEWSDLWSANVYRTQANLLGVKGRYGEAEPLYRSALESHRAFYQDNPDSIPYHRLIVSVSRSELGLNLMRQGQFAAAEVEARGALTDILRHDGRYSLDTAVMLRRLVVVIAAQGRAVEAEGLARALVDIYQKMGVPADSYRLALARRDLADTLVVQRKWPAALEQFDAIKSGLASDRETFERFFAADLAWALALLGADRTDEARGIADAAFQRNRETVGAKHYNTAEAQGVLAIALARLGERKAALAAFAEALPILLTRSRQTEDETTTKAARARRLEWILEGYIDLLAADGTADPKAAAEAFRVADVARGRSVQRALSSSAVRAAAKDPDLVDLVRREQDAQKQISALYGLLVNATASLDEQRKAAAAKDLRVRIDDLRSARAALAEEIERRFPDYAALINPKPATVEQIRAGLGPDEALVSFYVGEDASYVWAVPKSGSVSFAVAGLGRAALSKRVTSLRGALDPEAEVLGDIPDFDVAGAYELYASLLKPVEKGWKGAKHLIVVAHGPLGQLPLSVLPTQRVSLPKERAPLFSKYRSVPWLARSHAVSYAPSVSSFLTLRRLPGGDGTRLAFAGFGDPVFGGAEASAPPAKPAQVASRGRLSVRGLRLSRRSAPATRNVNSADLAKLPR